MKNKIAFVLVLAVIVLYTGCGDSATEIVGTLPIVSGIAVDTLVSKGDTVIVTWTALDSTLVDGYYLWARATVEGPWMLAEICEKNAGTHIANGTAFYTVMAFSGNDSSSDIGLSSNTKTNGISEIRQLFDLRPVGFRVDLEGDSIVAGDPVSPQFEQHFIVAMNIFGERQIFPGNARPDIWPGGSRTRISSMSGLVAPAPDDSVNWRDSISYGGDFFLSLDNGYYCMLKGTHTFPDTASMTDTLVLKG
ncbi:MAG: hypothetical protein GY852_11020, partial [bacterium]|nr:hypothetical protein [bacterium]